MDVITLESALGDAGMDAQFLRAKVDLWLASLSWAHQPWLDMAIPFAPVVTEMKPAKKAPVARQAAKKTKTKRLLWKRCLVSDLEEVLNEM